MINVILRLISFEICPFIKVGGTFYKSLRLERTKVNGFILTGFEEN